MEWIQKPNSWGGAIGIYIYTHNIDLFSTDTKQIHLRRACNFLGLFWCW